VTVDVVLVTVEVVLVTGLVVKGDAGLVVKGDAALVVKGDADPDWPGSLAAASAVGLPTDSPGAAGGAPAAVAPPTGSTRERPASIAT